MRKYSRWIVALSLVLTCSAFAADEPQKKAPSQSVGGIADAKDAGAVTGLVKFKGKKPESKTITDIAGLPYCKNCYKEGELPKDPEFTIGKNGADDTVANVLVYVSKGLEGKTFTPPKEPALLDQVGCMYTPHVVAVMVGQTLAVKNSDATMHNVMASPEENSPFNFGMPAKDQVINKVFKHPELRMKVKCFMHPWMIGYVHVMDSPFFAVTGDDGSFTIKGLPPGEYELTVLHESSALQATPETAKLKVTAGGTEKVDFVYEMKGKK